MKSQIFINKFQKGSNENANLGTGNIVGFDVYSKKGIALLAKKSSYTAGLPATPHFLETSNSGTTLWCQMSDGSVYYSNDEGASWTDSSFPGTPISDGGNGLIYFQGYVFAFTPTKIYYHNSDPTSGSWTDWTTAKALGSLTNQATSPIVGCHFPFLFPSNRGFYFANGGTVGFVGQVGTTTFDPTGSSGTNFLYTNSALTLPSLTYSVNTLEFLPPSKLAISAYAFQNQQGCDLITWDTTTTNKFDPPLRLYSDSLGVSQGGIKQLVSRNQVLFAVSGGTHTLYETNGATFNLRENVGLYSNIRNTGGAENIQPSYFNSYPQAIAVVGNKLLTGIATTTNTSSYPATGYGIFPIGVWSLAFDKDQASSFQCEFTIPDMGIIAPYGSGSYAKITCIKPISNAKIAVGFAYKINTGTVTTGVAIVDTFNYIDSLELTSLESELFEIGTPLNPQVINNIEVNLAKNLLANQQIEISYRKTIDSSWTTIATYTGDGTKNYYKTTKNEIGATQFVQFRVRAKTGSPNGNDSPELRTVILS